MLARLALTLTALALFSLQPCPCCGPQDACPAPSPRAGCPSPPAACLTADGDILVPPTTEGSRAAPAAALPAYPHLPAPPPSGEFPPWWEPAGEHGVRPSAVSRGPPGLA